MFFHKLARKMPSPNRNTTQRRENADLPRSTSVFGRSTRPSEWIATLGRSQSTGNPSTIPGGLDIFSPISPDAETRSVAKGEEVQPPVTIKIVKERITEIVVHRITTPYDIVQEISCSICFEVMVSPGVLASCQHSFCLHCIEQWFVIKGFPECPVCREYTLDHPMRYRFMETIIEKHLDAVYRSLEQEGDVEEAQSARKERTALESAAKLKRISLARPCDNYFESLDDDIYDLENIPAADLPELIRRLTVESERIAANLPHRRGRHLQPNHSAQTQTGLTVARPPLLLPSAALPTPSASVPTPASSLSTPLALLPASSAYDLQQASRHHARFRPGASRALPIGSSLHQPLDQAVQGVDRFANFEPLDDWELSEDGDSAGPSPLTTPGVGVRRDVAANAAQTHFQHLRPMADLSSSRPSRVSSGTSRPALSSASAARLAEARAYLASRAPARAAEEAEAAARASFEAELAATRAAVRIAAAEANASSIALTAEVAAVAAGANISQLIQTSYDSRLETLRTAERIRLNTEDRIQNPPNSGTTDDFASHYAPIQAVLRDISVQSSNNDNSTIAIASTFASLPAGPVQYIDGDLTESRGSLPSMIDRLAEVRQRMQNWVDSLEAVDNDGGWLPDEGAEEYARESAFNASARMHRLRTSAGPRH